MFIKIKYDEVMAHKLGEELVLFNKKSKKGYVLNKTSTMIWNLLDKKISLGEIMQILAKNFNKPEAEIKSDVDSFIRTLLEKGFVSENNGQ